jgi:hypothetical protein
VRHVLHLRAEASLPAIQATLSHTRAKCIALVFPLGQPPAVDTGALLSSLVMHCRVSDADMAIIGGDERLRASAVAAGFAVATTLDEWETSSLPAVRAPRGHPGPQDDDWEKPRLSLVGDHDDRAPVDDWDDEPPEYVIELMEMGGTYPGPRLLPQAASLHDHAPEDDDESYHHTAERYDTYEATMTDTIRDTAGLPPLSSLPPSARKPEGGTSENGGWGEPEPI